MRLTESYGPDGSPFFVQGSLAKTAVVFGQPAQCLGWKPRAQVFLGLPKQGQFRIERIEGGCALGRGHALGSCGSCLAADHFATPNLRARLFYDCRGRGYSHRLGWEFGPPMLLLGRKPHAQVFLRPPGHGLYWIQRVKRAARHWCARDLRHPGRLSCACFAADHFAAPRLGREPFATRFFHDSRRLGRKRSGRRLLRDSRRLGRWSGGKRRRRPGRGTAGRPV